MKKSSTFFLKKVFVLILSFLSITAVAQTLTVKGTVKDPSGDPIIGGSIIIQGTQKGTVTDVEGNYTLSNVPAKGKLTFSYLGMVTQVIDVNGRTVINVNMAENSKVLSEVVVTALGIKREQKALGYAMTELKGDQLNANLINPVSALQGKVAGVEIAQSDGGMFGSTKILIRGASTLGKNNQPIYVVDGVILDNAISNSGDADWSQAAGDYGNELKNLNPDDFETVSVLKGAPATALYGSRGLNGAVVITTKSGKKNKGLGVHVTQTFGIDHLFKQPDLQNVYGDGALSGYVDYGTTDSSGNYYRFDNKHQFMLNADHKPTLMGDWQGMGFGPKFDGSQIEYYDHTYRAYEAVNNNFKDAYNLGFNTNTNVAVSGGNDKTTFYTSLSFKRNTGTLPNNSFSRLSAMAKATHDITDKVNLEASISFANSNPKNAQPNIGEYFIDGTFSRAYDPDYLKHKYKGSHGGLADSSYGDEYGTIPGRGLWWNIYENSYSQKETSVRPALILNVKFADWVNFRAEGNYNYYYRRSEDKQLGTGYANTNSGYYGMSMYTKEQTNLNASFNFNKSLSDWNVGGFIRGDYYNNVEQSSSMNTNGGLIVPGQYFIKNSKDAVSYTGLISGQKRMLSVAFQGSISWKNQIYVDVTGRTDWSSSLLYTDKHGHYSYFYPSVSGSWLVSESFKLPEFISFAKLRASWAQVGNDTDPYIINTAYTLGTSSTVNGNVYSLSLPSTVYSNNLKPERKNSWEVGLDWRFFNNRIGIDATYYKENTKNQIMTISVPNVSGISAQKINAGNIQNQGIELALNTIPFQNKDWKWTLDFTYTKNNNKIIALHQNVADYILLDGTPDYGNYRIGSVAKVGASYGILMSDSKKSIDPSTGLPILKWNDGQRASYYARSGKVEEVGSLVPDFLGSLSTGVSFKNWTLSSSLDMRFGGLVASYGSRYGTAYGYTKKSLNYSAPEYGGLTWTSKFDNIKYDDGVIPEGIFPAGTKIGQADGSIYTVASGGETFASLYQKGVVEPTHASAWNYRLNSWGAGVVNDDWVRKLNYIALREISLSYRVPKTFSHKMGANDINLTLTGRNLGYLLNNMPNGENPESVRGTSATEFRVRTFSGFTANYMFTINANF